ncbi:hypothetical protein D020_2962B, partial [Vibrio parahaemolyticus SBR10290]
ASFFAARAP